MSDGSRLGQLLWDEDDPSGLRWGRMFWNQVRKKKQKKKKRKKKKTEDRSHLTHLDWVGDEDEQKHEDESSLECS